MKARNSERGETTEKKVFRITRALEQHERWLGGSSTKGVVRKRIAEQLGVSESTYSEWFRKDGAPRQSPTLTQLGQLMQRFLLAPFSIFDRDCDPFALEHEGLRWRLTGETAGTREHALRTAAACCALGWSPDEIGDRIATMRQSDDPGAEPPGAQEVAWMVRAGLGLGLLTLLPSARGDELGDAELAGELADALAQVTPSGIRPRVWVVPNVAHPDFERDPVALHLVARVAHRVVAEFIAMHRSVATLGIAGGPTVAAFVEAIGGASAPFPDEGPRRYTVVPLTLEPMKNHCFALSDALVGELWSRAAKLLGEHAVTAPTFKPFGYRVDHSIGRLEPESVFTVRAHYPHLDVAVFGCGCPEDDGGISRALDELGVHPVETPVTDVLHTWLARDGRPIPLPQSSGTREYLGASLRDAQRLARRRDKLALLLTTGAHKGLPLTVVARAGCTNAIVCDRAAAREALAALRDSAPRAA
jgi:DNA-binding transcriptional regulator LsrR (DeoR family)/transcriptional regulator with XRE-family HTH domain